jgi:hypothetical protein
MIQRSDGSRLPLEPLHASRIGRDVCRQNLDGYVPQKPKVLGTVDLSHAARAELLYDAIVAKHCADHSWLSYAGNGVTAK